MECCENQNVKAEFLAKAKENLIAATVCFEADLFNACANRAYYAALQAAVAAIAHAGIRSNRIDHGRVQADFSGELIQRRKSYPSKFKSYLSNMQFIRDKDDYTENSVSKEIAERMGILHFRRKVVDTFGNTMFP